MEPATSVVTACVDRQSPASGALDVDLQVEGVGPDSERVVEALFPPSGPSLAAVGRNSRTAAEYYGALRIETNLAKEIGENLTPTGAAVVAVVSEHRLVEVEDVLSPPGIHRYSVQLAALERDAEANAD